MLPDLSLFVDDDHITALQKLLNSHHADMLDRHVTPVGHGDFGASAPGTVLGANADLAHQHVIAALKEMAEGLSGFATALQQASQHLADVDQDSAVATTQLDSSLDRVDTTFGGANTQGTTATQATVGGQDPSANTTTPLPAATPTTTPAATSGVHPGGPQ